MRYRPLFIPLGVGLVLLLVAAVFGIRFGIAQSRFGTIVAKTAAPPVTGAIAVFTDGTRNATVIEEEVSATVEVTVTSGRIESLRLVSGKNIDTVLAQTVFNRVRDAGSTAVDAVSGATASSNVLLKAIAAAASAP